MPTVDPCHIIGEILGEPAHLMRNPVNAGYLCPFMNSTCTKTSQRIAGRYPVCSVFRRASAGTRPTTSDLIAVCPKRFMESSFPQDVIEHCWVGEKPKNLEFVHEVKMADLGTVDFVVADLSDARDRVREFVSVELQAIDITGTYEPAYSALVNSRTLERRPTYNFNWANVRKRYITQLISKGFFHHQWGTRIAAVLQDHVFERLQSYLKFDEIAIPKADVVFMVYRFADSGEDNEQRRELVLDRVVGTSHNSLMMRALYQNPPPRDEFCKRIIQRANG